MIKIVKEGVVPKPKRIIYKTTCNYCKCEFEFEAEDCLIIEKRINGNVFAVVDCPCCNKHVNCKRESLSFREVEENSNV